MTVYNFPDHVKGNTFKERKIKLGFNITGADVKMQFKVADNSNPFFEWSVSGDNLIVDNATQGILLMNKAILDFPPVTYFYDLQVIDADGNVTTYFKGSLSILNDITT